MAKTNGALFSLEASGQFGKSIIFDRRGYARGYNVPANPQTGDQGDVRQKLAAVQAALKLAGSTAKTAMKAVAPTGYRWNSNMVREAIGTGAGIYDAGKTAFAALTSQQRTDWDTAFAAVIVPDITYSTMATPSKGECAFILCRALYASGAITSPGTPSGTNQAAWQTALTA